MTRHARACRTAVRLREMGCKSAVEGLAKLVMAVLVTAIHGFKRLESSVDARVSAFGRPGHDDICE